MKSIKSSAGTGYIHTSHDAVVRPHILLAELCQVLVKDAKA